MQVKIFQNTSTILLQTAINQWLSENPEWKIVDKTQREFAIGGNVIFTMTLWLEQKSASAPMVTRSRTGTKASVKTTNNKKGVTNNE
jgi:hypothetical protein